MCASSSLTSKGLSHLASVITGTDNQLQNLNLGVSQTTKTHAQKFNYFDDTSVEALKSLTMTPSLRWLSVGGTVSTGGGVEGIRSAVGRSELVFFRMHRARDGAHAPNLAPLNFGRYLLRTRTNPFLDTKTPMDF